MTYLNGQELDKTLLTLTLMKKLSAQS